MAVAKLEKNMMPPPIVVFLEEDSPSETTIESLKLLLPAHDFSFRYGLSGAHVYVRSKESFDTLIKYLAFHSQEYFTFKPWWNKAKQIILKGVCTSMDVDDRQCVIEYLALNGFTCLKIDAIGERWQGSTSPIYLLEFAEDTDLDKVMDIEVIKIDGLPWAVIWQDYVDRRNRPVQCYRCQRFNHRSNYCYMNPRCVACGEDHWSKDCEKKKDDPAKCVNCDGKHRADDRECEKWIDYKERLAETAEKNKNSRALTAMINKQIAKTHASKETKKKVLSETKEKYAFKFDAEKLNGFKSFLDDLKKK